jgi:hypothetical protein
MCPVSVLLSLASLVSLPVVAALPTAVAAQDQRAAEGDVPPGREASVDPLTASWTLLLTLRDHPELATEQVLTTFTHYQIAAELGAWGRIDPPPSRLEAPPSVTYVWQEVLESDPELARGPLLDVFLRQGADWTFARRDPRWVERADTRAEAFIFARSAIEGRQPEFVARELFPVLEQHLDLAIASAPTRYQLTVELPRFAYDFDTQAIRFLAPGTMMTREGYTFSETMDILTPLPRRYYDLSSTDMGRAFYTNLVLTDRPSTQPGGHETSPTTAWRSPSPIGGSGGVFPGGLILGLDRAVSLSSFPLDPGRAEHLVTMNAIDGMGGGGLRARVFFEVERVDLVRRADAPEAVSRTLLARLERVEILGPEEEVVAELPAVAFPPPA